MQPNNNRHHKAFGLQFNLQKRSPSGYPVLCSGSGERNQTAVKGAQDYNNKLIEFTQANTNAAYDFVQKLSGVKSPSVFVELSTEHARKQFETLTEQTKQLAALAQKVMLATAEPLKTGVAKAQKP